MVTKEEVVAVKLKETEKEEEFFLENKVYESIFNIFELELEEISRFVAFTSGNMNTYSNKIHELHLRVCSEIENVLKIVIHKHFVSADEVKNLWDNDKSAFLGQKELTNKYEELKNELNKREKGKLDKFLFGFPDFLFYFKIAREKFNLHKKVIKFKRMVSQNLDWEIIQPFELSDGQDVPIWWTNYNKLKHNKIKNYNVCILGDLIRSISGLFILMNYLLKYQTGNTPITNANFALEKIMSFSLGDHTKFCSFHSKFFVASSAYQDFDLSIILPPRISEDEFQSVTTLDLYAPINKLRNLDEEEFESCKLKDLDLKSLEFAALVELDASGETVKDWKFRRPDHSIFYTYLNYVQVSNSQHKKFRELWHFAIFIN